MYVYLEQLIYRNIYILYIEDIDGIYLFSLLKINWINIAQVVVVVLRYLKKQQGLLLFYFV